VNGNGGSSGVLKLEVWDVDGRYGSAEKWIIVDDSNFPVCPE